MRTRLGQARFLEIMVPLVLAAAVRLAPVAGSGFPLNDGGMFWTMAGDLRANGFVPPMFTTYNGGSIPFAYPPLGIYLAAVFHGTDGIAGLTYATWAPAILSILAVGVVFALALELTGSRTTAFMSSCAFALVPIAFGRMIEGGGVTRALGALLALLSALAALRARTRGGRRCDVAAAVFGGLALLSHPTAGLAAVVATAVLRPDRHRGSLAATAVVIGGIVLVASPWWLIVLVLHGPETLVSAAALGGPVDAAKQLFARLLTWAVSGELYFPYVGALGLFGMLLAVARRQFRRPVWFVLQILVEPRGGGAFASVPLAIVAGQGGEKLLALLFPAAAGNGSERGLGEMFGSIRGVRWSVPVTIAVVAATVLLTIQRPEFPARAIGADDRAAMEWVQGHVPIDATFAVVTGDVYGYQGTDEWFPSLAGRVSVATQQGTEWLGRGRWRAAYEAHGALQACASRDISCLDEWSVSTSIRFAYVYSPKGRLYGPMSAEDCCTILRASLSGSPRARLVFDGPGASIWEFAPSPQ